MTKTAHNHTWFTGYNAIATLLAAATAFTLSAPADAATASNATSQAQPDCTADTSYNPLLPASGAAQRKSARILGGTPSKLEMLKEQQASLIPSQNTRPYASSAQTRSVRLRANAAQPCKPAYSASRKARLADVKNALRVTKPGVSYTHADDILGMAAVSIRRTPMDYKWNSAFAAKNSAAPALRQWMQKIGVNRGAGKMELIKSVNIRVNAAVTYTDDLTLSGKRDSWAPALQTLQRGRGDCEDYAIVKMQMLMAAGVSEKDMQLVVVRDLIRRAGHAILVVKVDGQMLLLDNNTDRMVDARQRHDYVPVFSFSGNQKWMHGRRYQPNVQTAPVQLASR